MRRLATTYCDLTLTQVALLPLKFSAMASSIVETIGIGWIRYVLRCQNQKHLSPSDPNTNV